MTIHLNAKAAAIGMALLSATLLNAPSAFAQGQSNPRCDVTVTATGSSPSDSFAVNTAINGPHTTAEVTVCLVGEFDFGTTDLVVIDPTAGAPVPQIEELNITGLDGATIVGGLQPLRFAGTSSLPRLSITNLRFENPFVTAVSIFRSNEFVEISGIEIDGVQSLFVPAFGVTLREGITITTAFAEIAGEVRIKDNLVDGGVFDSALDLTSVNSGIGLYGAFGAINPNPFSANVLVSNNHVRNWSGSGIAAISLNDARFELNRIEPGAFGNQIPGGACAVPTGLGAAAGMSLTGIVDSTVLNNTIILTSAQDGNGAAVCNAGIILLGNNGAATSVSADNEFLGNIVTGAGRYAFVVGLDTSAAEQNNSFVGSNVSTFAPSGAHLFLGGGANGNSFKGHYPSVEGNLAGNSITGQ